MFGFLKRLFGKKSPDPVALILLNAEPRILTRGHVAQALSAATGAPFAEDRVTEEQFCYHRLVIEGYELTVASSPTPYIPKDRASNAELRQKEVIERHNAAILVDCWAATEGRDRAGATPLMGKIVAALVDESSLGVYCFHNQRLNVMDERLLGMLRSGEAMEAMQTMTFDPIVGIDSGDEAIEAAMAEARRRWPEFAEAFGNRKTADLFIVKARFGEGDRVEHMWLTVDQASLEGAKGVLESDPFGLPRPRKGDRVQVEREEISDWIFVSDGQSTGNFTNPALESARNS